MTKKQDEAVERMDLKEYVETRLRVLEAEKTRIETMLVAIQNRLAEMRELKEAMP
jgi:hypothetical protein